MGTLHIVGINLQHGLRVHVGGLRGAEVLVGFLTDGLLRFLPDEHTTSKGSHRIVVENVFIKLVTCAMWGLMIDERIVVYVLFLIGHHAAVAMAFGPFALENEVEAIARYAVVQGDDVVIDAAVGLLFDVDIAQTRVFQMRFF